LAETLALMMARGALLFGDGHLDGWAMWKGDKAEKLTSGVARNERNSLCGFRPRKGDITWKLPLRTMWIFFTKHGSLMRLDLGTLSESVCEEEPSVKCNSNRWNSRIIIIYLFLL
jgi:hypothetical protein